MATPVYWDPSLTCISARRNSRNTITKCSSRCTIACFLNPIWSDHYGIQYTCVLVLGFLETLNPKPGHPIDLEENWTVMQNVHYRSRGGLSLHHMIYFRKHYFLCMHGERGSWVCETASKQRLRYFWRCLRFYEMFPSLDNFRRR
jgi:hypothetical protein